MNEQATLPRSAAEGERASVGRVRAVWRWWPVVLAPLSVVVVYAIRTVPLDAKVFGVENFGRKLWIWMSPTYQEVIALMLMPLAVLLSGVRLLREWLVWRKGGGSGRAGQARALNEHAPSGGGEGGSRVRLFLIWTVFTAVLLCREIHFAGTSTGVYVAAGLIAAWCYVWRDSLKRHVWRTAKGRWIAIAGWSYLVALIIQRRALRFLPDEQVWHAWMEEISENIAHLMLIVATLI